MRLNNVTHDYLSMPYTAVILTLPNELYQHSMRTKCHSVELTVPEILQLATRKVAHCYQ